MSQGVWDPEKNRIVWDNKVYDVDMSSITDPSWLSTPPITVTIFKLTITDSLNGQKEEMTFYSLKMMEKEIARRREQARGAYRTELVHHGKHDKEIILHPLLPGAFAPEVGGKLVGGKLTADDVTKALDNLQMSLSKKKTADSIISYYLSKVRDIARTNIGSGEKMGVTLVYPDGCDYVTLSPRCIKTTAELLIDAAKEHKGFGFEFRRLVNEDACEFIFYNEYGSTMAELPAPEEVEEAGGILDLLDF